MDLRAFCTSDELLTRAMRVLNYQPFLITNDIQTGAAYSWLYAPATARCGEPGECYVFRRDRDGPEWDKISETNGRLRRMYDDIVAEVAHRFPRGSMLDFGCNNGYFPVAASKLGMTGVGIDGDGRYSESVDFLNKLLGTGAKFIHSYYDPTRHRAELESKYDVVCSSVVMGNQPDPVDFLVYLGSLAKEAIFFFGQFLDTDDLIISYQRPHPSLGGQDLPFPWRFNDNTRLSRGLLYYGLEEMGFKNIREMPWSENWLPQYYRFSGPDNSSLEKELRNGSRHYAVLAWR